MISTSNGLNYYDILTGYALPANCQIIIYKIVYLTGTIIAQIDIFTRSQPDFFFTNMFPSKKADISVILNIWKRNYLEEQLEALSKQTIQPAQIWILHSENHMPKPSLLKKHSSIHYINSSFNLKYFWRFSIPHHIKNRYTWVLDDDIIPGKYWIEMCLDACEKYNAIIAGNGRVIEPDNFFPEKVIDHEYWEKYFIGDCRSDQVHNFCPKDTFVDYGCSSFFFKTTWLNHFWSIEPLTLETGEDMHLSATCNIRGRIPTIVPKQTSKHESSNLKPEYSIDENASWKQSNFLTERSRVLKYLIEEKNWKPLLWKQEKV